VRRLLLDCEHRRDCFERHRVIEYVALRLKEPVEWLWNRLIDGKFSVIETADHELIMSTALHGDGREDEGTVAQAWSLPASAAG
jgi:hypothetical protein